jgi:hypothetical protein
MDEERLRRALERVTSRPAWRRAGGGEVDEDAVVARIRRRLRTEARPFAPATTHEVFIGRKKRVLFRFGVEDTVLHFAAASLLLPILDRTLPESVWSYRKGRSADQAVLAFGAYLGQRRRRHGRGPGTGTFVLRRDIESYGDRIRIDGQSPLWPLVDDVAGALLVDDADRGLLRGLLAPAVVRDDGTVDAARQLGAPTGSPLHTVLTSLYLLPLDRAFAGLDVDRFYGRFGDDVLIAAGGDAQARADAARFDAVIASLSLSAKAEKAESVFLNAAGRPLDAPAGWLPRAHVTWLGWRLDATGAVSTTTPKARALLEDVRRRAMATAGVSAHLAPEVRRALVCAAVTTSFDDAALRVPGAAWTTGTANSRAWLKDLDHRLALIVAEALSGRRGPAAFRRHPPRRLRGAGLLRLVRRRNRSRP